VTQHKEGYKAHCNTPQLTRQWKEGQAWACDCGNVFKVTVLETWAGYSKNWEFVK